MHSGTVNTIEKAFSHEVTVGIVAARFNEEIVESLVNGAIKGLVEQGISREKIKIMRVPGAFELPLGVQNMMNQVDACIALGAVIRGDTPHFDYVAGECASGLMQIGLKYNKPVIFGVLTTDNLEQAQARAGGVLDGSGGNKGFDAAMSAIDMLNFFHQVKKNELTETT
jgi:6,7-dimethyl-8-ribityllumazine synthase